MTWNRLCIPKKFGGLGFRKLRDFNIAMLGKQAWRLMQNPNTLVGRVFKAKYYPHTSFLNAKVGNNPSYVWRSIWETQAVIKEGIRWRVGNGKSINIWTKPWLPNDEDGFLQTEKITHLESTTVSALLTEDGAKWDEDILNDLFQIRDRELILNIPLSN